MSLLPRSTIPLPSPFENRVGPLQKVAGTGKRGLPQRSRWRSRAGRGDAGGNAL